ncbi:TPA: RNA-binding protein, partial [Streptococcus pyogenes]|nr:RNA-binding protein [Streptococcus pyogenes]
MNDLLATVITGLIKEENANDYFIQKEGFTFTLSKAEGERQI